MAFDRENLTVVTNNVKSGVVVKKWLYYNEGGDDVTSASYFSDLRFVAGDLIEVIDAKGNIQIFYVASVTSAGVVTLGGIQAITADGTTLTLTPIITFDTTAEAFSYALPDGLEGQRIIMSMIVDGGNDAVITPANFTNGSTLTFADAGDTCELIFLNSSWVVLSNSGVVVA